MAQLKYLLDTNILSEVIRPQPNPHVMQRFSDAQSQMCISAVTWHELWFGVERMPEGKKRAQLTEYLNQVVAQHFSVLPYSVDAARWHATQRSRLMGQGLTPSYADAQIASVAVTNQLILATRNIKDVKHFTELNYENWFEPTQPLM